jgi:hypothetical protein
MACFTDLHKLLRDKHVHVFHVRIDSPEVRAVARRLNREVTALARKYAPLMRRAKSRAQARKRG